MPKHDKPPRGSAVTFLLRDDEGERYRVGEVTGPVEPDPTTGETWIGVRLPSGRPNLIPMTTVLHIAPPHRDAA